MSVNVSYVCAYKREPFAEKRERESIDEQTEHFIDSVFYTTNDEAYRLSVVFILPYSPPTIENYTLERNRYRKNQIFTRISPKIDLPSEDFSRKSFKKWFSLFCVDFLTPPSMMR